MRRTKRKVTTSPERYDSARTTESSTPSTIEVASGPDVEGAVAPFVNSGQISDKGSIQDSDEITEGSATYKRRRTTKIQRSLSHVAAYGPAHPRSIYEGWQPPAQHKTEADAIKSLLHAHDQLVADADQKPDYNFIQLDEFSVYQPATSAWHALELASLDRLSQDGYHTFLFDGVLSVGAERYYVEKVPFKTLTVDRYGDLESVDLANQLCIQSPIAQQHNVWYQLRKPAVEYSRFYTPFLWLARFTKHFVDFLLESDSQITLAHFKQTFYLWLQTHYTDPSFTAWIAEAKLTDFQTTVVAHYYFLWKECCGLDYDSPCSHPIWKEIDPTQPDAIPEQPNIEQRTVVTPYTFECFQGMYFGDQLEQRTISDGVGLEALRRKQSFHLTPGRHHEQQPKISSKARRSVRTFPEEPLLVSVGDVVTVRPDADGKWKDVADVWYAYVQGTGRAPTRLSPSRRLLDVLWLYCPKDTTLGTAFYPFKNEMFLSDNCSCGREALDSDCVIGKVHVTWFARNPHAETGLFVRQKFRTVHEMDTYDFVSLHKNDFSCQCGKHLPAFEDCQAKYSPGDTVLVEESTGYGKRLQPAQIVRFEIMTRRVHLRKLLRKHEMGHGAHPNELVLTNEQFELGPSKIIRKCHVRSFADGDVVTPYDRDGTGDFWYLTSSEEPETNGLITRTSSPSVDNASQEKKIPAPQQGWDPTSPSPRPKLRGMGIFCGGGSFDRGLEEGGGVEFQYAVDWASQALHSYRANASKDIEFFLGSVDDCLSRAMAGDEAACIPRVGAVQLISAGSPCPGFSTLQRDRHSYESKQNASKVASVVSFADLYAPEYLVLENVPFMTMSTAGPNKDQNVFAQIVAALVGLGYQVQQFLVDAWSHGSSQLRSRVFILASAPGLQPLLQPALTHDHPLGQKGRDLGKSSNGLPFGSRRMLTTPFPSVSIADSTKDLPHIGDGQPGLCIPFPDHRTATREGSRSRHRMLSVPQYPQGLGLIQALHLGVLRGEPLEHCKRVNPIRRLPSSKIYRRVFPNKPLGTLTTKIAPGDGIMGWVTHWSQNRVLTIMEARRAQGFLDHEVIVGKPNEQLKIVGNSVDRKAALVLGLAVRESWMSPESLPRAPAQVIDIGEGQVLKAATQQDLLANEQGQEDEAMLEFIEHVNAADTEQDFEDLPRRESMEHVHDDTSTAQEVAEDAEGDSSTRQETETPSPKIQRHMDNRQAKLALLGLTEDDGEDISINGFEAINRIFARRAAEGKPITLEKSLSCD